MATYMVRVLQQVERVVTVEGWTEHDARAAAEAGAGQWLDGGKGTSVGIEACEVMRVPDEPDCMDAYKYRQEA